MNVQISKCQNLILEIYVIGYTECGESLILLFKDSLNNGVLYSVVIDSYRLADGTFKTEEILVAENVASIDLLCWTHPDLDHTKGIDDLLNKYCNKYSKVLIPTYLNGRPDDPINYNKGDVEIIHKIFGFNNRFNKVVKPIGVSSATISKIQTVTFSDELNEIETEFYVAAPHTDYIVENIISGTTIHKNHLSICLMIKVGPYKFTFCGDIEERTINNINTSIFDNPLFLKIPHHASSGSENLLKYLQITKQSMSCTTTFLSKGLPNEDLLKKYKEQYQYCHSTGPNTTGDSEDNYGILKYECDLFGKQEVRITCEGHAHKV